MNGDFGGKINAWWTKLVRMVFTSQPTIKENTMLELTRIYRVAATGETKTQSIVVVAAHVASLRASNRLNPGDLDPPAHRSTITLASGAEIDLADKYSVVKAALADALNG